MSKVIDKLSGYCNFDTRAVLAVGLVGAVIYIAVTSGKIPGELSTLAGVVVTYYFKTREKA